MSFGLLKLNDPAAIVDSSFRIHHQVISIYAAYPAHKPRALVLEMLILHSACLSKLSLATKSAVETALPLRIKSRAPVSTYITGYSPAPRYQPYVSLGNAKPDKPLLVQNFYHHG